MKEWLGKGESAAIVIAGLTLLVAIARAMQSNLLWLDREIIFAPGFSLCLWAAVCIALLIIIRGVTAVNTAGDSLAFILLEGPVALLAGVLSIVVVNRWRIRTDVRPMNHVEAGDALPLAVRVLVSLPLFWTATALVSVFIIFAVARGARGHAVLPKN